MATIKGADRRVLVRRIRDLAAALLPAPDPTGSYSVADYDRTSAFLLLCHAEIEWFLEQRCLSVADAVVKSWTLDSRPRSTIISLAAFAHSGGTSALPEPSTTGPPKIRAVIDEAKSSYSRVVASNNGVKASNLLQMLLPIGIRESQLPTLFLADMDVFGAVRGEHAHRAVGAKAPPDPVDSRKLVTRLLLAMRRLDVHLLALASE